MELKEYFNLIKKEIRLFSAVIVVIVAATLLFFFFRPEFYNVSVILNVTRLGSQATQDYRYDDFYRLQADERFSDTIVEWLKSPRIIADIYSISGINQKNSNLIKLPKAFSVERRSSQIVSVNFSSPEKETARKISEGISKVVSANTQKLNEDQKEDTWFKVLSQEPVIQKYTPDYGIILLASFFAGIFLAFWVVMIKNYLK